MRAKPIFCRRVVMGRHNVGSGSGQTGGRQLWNGLPENDEFSDQERIRTLLYGVNSTKEHRFDPLEKDVEGFIKGRTPEQLAKAQKEAFDMVEKGLQKDIEELYTKYFGKRYVRSPKSPAFGKEIDVEFGVLTYAADRIRTPPGVDRQSFLNAIKFRGEQIAAERYPDMKFFFIIR